jgi:hypothetical protein
LDQLSAWSPAASARDERAGLPVIPHGGEAHPKRVMTATGLAATVRSTRQTGARSSRHRRDWQMTKASEYRSARRVQEASGWTVGFIMLAAIMQ